MTKRQSRFEYDVFLSYSAKDREVVRELAERLRGDGLRVWFNKWVVEPGDAILKRIEDGLGVSRVLVLCMSKHGFESEWAAVESGAFRFRDPANKDRRFIPLRLDDADIPDMLRQFAYVDWSERSDDEYTRLKVACRPVQEVAAPASRLAASLELVFSLGHTRPIYSVALSGDGQHALSGSHDRTVRVWEVETGRCLAALAGHTAEVWGVGLSRDSRRAVSGSSDKTVLVWEVETGRCVAALQGHIGSVMGVALSGNGQRALSGSRDRTVHVWEVETRRCLAALQGHSEPVYSVALSGDGRRRAVGVKRQDGAGVGRGDGPVPSRAKRPHRRGIGCGFERGRPHAPSQDQGIGRCGCGR